MSSITFRKINLISGRYENDQRFSFKLGTPFLFFLVHRAERYDIRGKEVDFVARKRDRLIYLQSTYLLADEQTIRREYVPLEAIHDNYEKFVVSLDDLSLPSNSGIRHIQAWKLAKEIIDNF